MSTAQQREHADAPCRYRWATERAVRSAPASCPAPRSVIMLPATTVTAQRRRSHTRWARQDTEGRRCTRAHTRGEALSATTRDAHMLDMAAQRTANIQCGEGSAAVQDLHKTFHASIADVVVCADAHSHAHIPRQHRRQAYS